MANISCSNFVLFDKDYKIKRYNSEVDILEEFFTFRYDMYGKRKAQMLRDFQQELDKYSNQHRFIKSIIDGTIKIFNRKKVDIEGLLFENGFKKYEEIFPEKEKESILEVKNNSQDDQNDSEDHTPRNRGYDYLLSMNIMTFSSERMEKLEKMIETKQQEIKKLKESSIEQLWTDDLQEFEDYYKEKCLRIAKDERVNFDMIDIAKMPVQEHRKVINNPDAPVKLA